MAYLAIYAASAPFWKAHPEWALYDAQGKAIPFGDRFLGLMNPSPECPWSRHLLEQAEHAIDELGFDGLHIDQYGEPKVAFSAAGVPVDLPAAFAHFVDEYKRRRPRSPAVFNAIDGWPPQVLSASMQDFAYMEVWPHHPSYADLRSLLERARRESGGKPLVVALYIPPERQEAICQVNALVAALGGTRIELGEGACLLTDPYFPNHQPIPPPLNEALRRHYDFIVRYGELIGPGAAEAPEHRVEVPTGVWAFPRRSRGWVSAGLVNMTGIETARWDQHHPPPTPLAQFSVELEVPGAVERAWWASPDRDDPGMTPVPAAVVGRRLRVGLPGLARWGLLACELVEGD